MKKIKFSNEYFKFMNMFSQEYKEAKLLLALRIKYTDLSAFFVKYDTLYGEIGDLKNYELPKTDLILLLFISDNTQQLFSTLRRFTPIKWDYYKKSEGEMFEVVCPSTR